MIWKTFYWIFRYKKPLFVVDLIGGGTDTIAITLSWNIVLMCCFPQVQRKAAAEVDEFIRLNGRLPVFSERLQLPYCIAVIKECLRFRPTTSFGIPHAVYDDGKQKTHSGNVQEY